MLQLRTAAIWPAVEPLGPWNIAIDETPRA